MWVIGGLVSSSQQAVFGGGGGAGFSLFPSFRAGVEGRGLGSCGIIISWYGVRVDM